MSHVRRIALRLATVSVTAVSMTAVLSGCGQPDVPDPAPDTGSGWACDLSGCGYYLDRPTTQQWAEFFRKWDKAADSPAAFATAYCARFGATVAGVCAAGVISTSAMFLDHLQQADEMGGCLEFQIFDLHDPGGMLIAPYNGEKCTGTRT